MLTCVAFLSAIHILSHCRHFHLFLVIIGRDIIKTNKIHLFHHFTWTFGSLKIHYTTIHFTIVTPAITHKNGILRQFIRLYAGLRDMEMRYVSLFASLIFFHCLSLSVFFCVFSLLLTMNTSLFAVCGCWGNFAVLCLFCRCLFYIDFLYLAASLASFRIEVSFKSFPAALIVTHKYDIHPRNLKKTRAT